MDDQLVLYNQRLIPLFLILFVLVGAAAGLWAFIETGNAIGLLVTVGGCLFTVKFAPGLLRKAPRASIDAQGIREYLYKRERRVLWSDVQRAWIIRSHQNSLICVLLKDREKYLQQMSPADRERAPDEWSKWGHLQFDFLSRDNDLVWDYICALSSSGQISVPLSASNAGVLDTIRML